MAAMLDDKSLKLEYYATFTDEILPFKIKVKQEFLDLTQSKVSLTRFVEDLEDQEPFTDGPPKSYVQKTAQFWQHEYNWREVEARINDNMMQFTTIVQTVPTEHHQYPLPTPLHFVHHRSTRPDAIPLLFVHGWPGSFLEVDTLLQPLTDPDDPKMPAFHVVAPSVPGYGFSPSPRRPGFGYRQAGATFRSLMLKLGYEKYVFQGGDAGDPINRYAAVDFPDNVVSGLSNFWMIPPTPTDLERLRTGQADDDETAYMERYQGFINHSWSYAQLQQTQPLRLAIGMNDSPIGLAMWIYTGLRTGVTDPEIWTSEEVITWTMMHWINGPYGAFSLYKNGANDGSVSLWGLSLLPYVHQPVAISEFPFDVWYRLPLEWARRGGNVKYRTVHNRGGHFATVDAPDLLIADIRRFFGDAELSMTKAFAKT